MDLAVEGDDTGQRTMLGREARHRFIPTWVYVYTTPRGEER